MKLIIIFMTLFIVSCSESNNRKTAVEDEVCIEIEENKMICKNKKNCYFLEQDEEIAASCKYFPNFLDSNISR